MSVIGDVLSALILHLSGYSNQDYALRHHSGYLGEKSRLSSPVHPSLEDEQIELRHVYETLHKENHDFQTNNWMLEDLPYLQTLNIDSIVEIGCGNGRFAIEAAKHFKLVTAIDWAASPVITSSNLPENLKYIVSDVSQANIPVSSAVVSADFFELIATNQILPLVEKLACAAPIQFHKISCYPDSRGLHLVVQSPEEWLEMFKQVDKAFIIHKIEYRRERNDQPVVTIVR
jgi:SAM-dependent methyltransferase